MVVKQKRPALRYYGGKWRIANWIISHFPPHDCYVEPFSGGASVLLRKQKSPFEVLNDLDDDVVTFFRVLRDYADELVARIEMTPWARTELLACYKPTDDPIEQARRFYVRSNQGWFGGARESLTGWRYQKRLHEGRGAIAEWGALDHLLAAATRLRSVQIECDDAFKVIPRFDTPQTLFYVDPPYPHATRGWKGGKDGYRHEMSDADHRRLAHLLNDVQGMVVLSSYTSDLYTELYPDWHVVSREARTGRTHKNAVEVLLLSPRTTAVLNQQMPLQEAA